MLDDKNVLELMKQEGINFGGEQSGHVIISDFAKTGDGLVSALQVLALLIKTGQKHPKYFVHLHFIRKNLSI